MTELRKRMRLTREQWNALTVYGRFEQLVAWTLTIVIAAVIVVAMVRLISDVVTLLVIGVAEPLQHSTFQTVFAGIMTVLISMEFTHSLLHAPARLRRVVQVRTVLLIALLALSRKLIIIDLEQLSASFLAALALVLVTLGFVLWLLRGIDPREED